MLDFFKKHWIATIITVTIVIIVAKYLVDRNKPNPKDEPHRGTATTVNNNGLDITRVLKVGSKGAEVSELQTILNEMIALGIFPFQLPIVVDGIFGTETANAVNGLIGTSDVTIEEAEFQLAKSSM